MVRDRVVWLGTGPLESPRAASRDRTALGVLRFWTVRGDFRGKVARPAKLPEWGDALTGTPTLVDGLPALKTSRASARRCLLTSPVPVGAPGCSSVTLPDLWHSPSQGCARIER